MIIRNALVLQTFTLVTMSLPGLDSTGGDAGAFIESPLCYDITALSSDFTGVTVAELKVRLTSASSAVFEIG